MFADCLTDDCHGPFDLVRVPVAYDADHVSDMIVDQLAAVMARLGIPESSV